jgi:hypothetical protein
MKRKASMAFVLALSAALAMTGVVAAKDHPAHGRSGTHATGPVSGSVATSLTVKGNASHPGGVFRVLAVLHAPKDLRPPTIDAIVHFSTGDVPVVLTESGKGAAYHGNVTVPGNEPAGVVMIDATAVVNGVTLTATGSGKIVVETTQTSETTSETSETGTTTTETATCTVTTTETVSTTVTSTATETSTSSETTDTAQSSETDESSEASESETSESSEADESDSCDHESADSQSDGLTSQSIVQFFANLESLVN